MYFYYDGAKKSKELPVQIKECSSIVCLRMYSDRARSINYYYYYYIFPWQRANMQIIS